MTTEQAIALGRRMMACKPAPAPPVTMHACGKAGDALCGSRIFLVDMLAAPGAIVDCAHCIERLGPHNARGWRWRIFKVKGAVVAREEQDG